MINVFLLLGSNLGNRELFLQQAVQLIEQNIAPVTQASAFMKPNHGEKPMNPII
jgi:7,8-dihydro-6-hydroxymethylpterin-pyrophosphokinase